MIYGTIDRKGLIGGHLLSLRTTPYFPLEFTVPSTYGSSLTQIFRKLMGSLLSPWACSLMGALSYFL
jgi:hypothetical protein